MTESELYEKSAQRMEDYLQPNEPQHSESGWVSFICIGFTALLLLNLVFGIW